MRTIIFVILASSLIDGSLAFKCVKSNECPFHEKCVTLKTMIKKQLGVEDEEKNQTNANVTSFIEHYVLLDTAVVTNVEVSKKHKALTGGTCVPKEAKDPDHLPNRYCKYDYHCPLLYQCLENTCFRNNPIHHAPSIVCYGDEECPDRFTCDPEKRTCYESTKIPHRRFAVCEWTFQCPYRTKCEGGLCIESITDSPHHPGTPCDENFECPPTHQCMDRTCVRDLERPIHMVGKPCDKTKPCPAAFECDEAERTCYSKHLWPLEKHLDAAQVDISEILQGFLATFQGRQRMRL